MNSRQRRTDRRNNPKQVTISATNSGQLLYALPNDHRQYTKEDLKRRGILITEPEPVTAAICLHGTYEPTFTRSGGIREQIANTKPTYKEGGITGKELSEVIQLLGDGFKDHQKRSV